MKPVLLGQTVGYSSAWDCFLNPTMCVFYSCLKLGNVKNVLMPLLIPWIRSQFFNDSDFMKSILTWLHYLKNTFISWAIAQNKVQIVFSAKWTVSSQFVRLTAVYLRSLNHSAVLQKMCMSAFLGDRQARSWLIIAPALENVWVVDDACTEIPCWHLSSSVNKKVM